MFVHQYGRKWAFCGQGVSWQGFILGQVERRLKFGGNVQSVWGYCYTCVVSLNMGIPWSSSNNQVLWEIPCALHQE